mmetsp:Transcript_14777/g.25034  ORF Transcript_14777/g.25034 Transcript_14777/m.25034 type:complete len:199 (-) Transcript_14777:798-1394(-)
MATETTTGAAPDQASVDTKILTDLGSVKEKMDLCTSMLNPGDGAPAPSLKSNEALLGVIGFLEACAPRMVELVEAGSQGALSEEVLMECLTVNDRLLKVLADVDTYAATESVASTSAAVAPKPSVEEQFGDLLLDEPEPNSVPAAPPVAGGKTTGDEPPVAEGKSTGEDPFGGEVDLLSATPMGGDAKVDADTKLPGL